ncbi:MAG: CatB-related O-acetyltransferase [Bacteroidota bacterium]|nr:CatB-related O-acetyltransferase [Bacteroidota bacterium]
MFEKIKKKFSKKLFSLLLSNNPELAKLFSGKYDFDFIANVIFRSAVSEKSKIYAPYKVHNSTVGEYTYISINSTIVATDIGKFCSIGPNFKCGWGIHPTNGLSTSPMFYSTKKQNGFSLSSEDKVIEQKRICIGNDVFIGMNVVVLDGVKIGDGAIIGAGTIVAKDVPPYAIMVGSPAIILRKRFDEKTIEALLEIQWWNFSDEKLKEVEAGFFDIDNFIKKHSLR